MVCYTQSGKLYTWFPHPSYLQHHSHRHHPISLSFIILPSSQNTMLSHLSLYLHAMIMSLHQVQHTASTVYTVYSTHQEQHTPTTACTEYSIHQVQYTPSTAYTKYSIHYVQHTPGTATTQECMSSFLLHDSKLIPECSFRFRCASLQIDHQQPALHESSKVQSTCPIPMLASSLTNGWSRGKRCTCQLTTSRSTDSRWATSRSTTSIYSSNFPQSRPPSASPNSLDPGLRVYLWNNWILASKRISQFTQLRPPRAYPNLLDFGLQVYLWVHMMMASKWISYFTRSWSPNASLHSHNHGPPRHIWVDLILTSKCISKLTELLHQSVYFSSLDPHLQG